MRPLTIFATLVAFAFLAAPAAATTLYAPEYYGPGDSVRSFNVAGDGSLTSTGAPSVIGLPEPGSAGIGSVALAPDGVRGVAGFYFNGGIQGLSFNPAGAVTPAQAVLGAHKGTIVAVAPNGQFAYQAIGGGTQGIDAYSMDAAGALTALSGSPFHSSEAFEGLAIRPDGKFLYAGEVNAIRPFAIAENGTLTALPATPFAGAGLLQFSPDGRHLIASNSSNQLASFNVGADGSLAAAGVPLTVGSTYGGFFSIAPNGRHVYITDYNGVALGGDPSVNAYTIADDGSLSFASATSTEPGRPRTVSVSPDGRYLYAGDTSDAKLLVSPINASGVLTGFRIAGDWHSGEPIPLVFRPEQAPTASFKSRATTKPLTMIFDGAATTSPDGSVDRFDWAFGDGATESSAVTPRAAHKFARAGTYPVTLTADNAGCSTRSIYNGQTTICVGSPAAASTVLVDTPPWITSLKVSPSSVGRRTRIKFKLTETARVSFYAQKRTSGRLVGTSCKKKSAKNAKLRKCARWVRASPSFTKSGKGNKTISFRFNGKVRGKAIKRGKYRLYAVATDKARGKSPSKTASFRIKN